MFYIGQRVLCVDSNWDFSWYSTHLSAVSFPKKGRIYHVRDIHMRIKDGEERFGLLLVEIVNATLKWTDALSEVSFNQGAFRPIIERKTSIEIFEKMLPPTPVKKDEVVSSLVSHGDALTEANRLLELYKRERRSEYYWTMKARLTRPNLWPRGFF